MTEYWLQKKTIGGWSMVTWYGDAEAGKAKDNYDACCKTGGYAWRLVKVETLFEQRLEDETEVDAPELEPVKKTSWGAAISPPKPVVNGWGNPAPKPEANKGWGSPQSAALAKAAVDDLMKREHGMVGKVWMMNHSLRQRGRFDPTEVESRKANGWIVAGPKTAFEG